MRLDYQLKVDAPAGKVEVTFINHDNQRATTYHMSLDTARELFRDKPHILKHINEQVMAHEALQGQENGAAQKEGVK